MTKRIADAGQAIAAALFAGAYYDQGSKYADDAAAADTCAEQTADGAGHGAITLSQVQAAAERGNPQADYYLSLLNGNREDEKKTVIDAAHRWKRGA